MIATGLVFPVPCLSRAFFNIVAPMGWSWPDVYQTQILTGLLGVGVYGGVGEVQISAFASPAEEE
jgi:hypothetical protein